MYYFIELHIKLHLQKEQDILSVLHLIIEWTSLPEMKSSVELCMKTWWQMHQHYVHRLVNKNLWRTWFLLLPTHSEWKSTLCRVMCQQMKNTTSLDKTLGLALEELLTACCGLEAGTVSLKPIISLEYYIFE